MCLFLIFTGMDFGTMKLNEDNAKNGDLFTTCLLYTSHSDTDDGNAFLLKQGQLVTVLVKEE